MIDGNPTQRRIRHNGALLPVDFCVNVTVNRNRADHGFVLRRRPARRTRPGARSPARHRWCACERPFPIVVTTNSGYPLDQNLYQAVKGMSAAAQIVSDGGYIARGVALQRRLPVARQFPFAAVGARLAARVARYDRCAPGFLVFDQWEAQLLALIQLKARVGL